MVFISVEGEIDGTGEAFTIPVVSTAVLSELFCLIA
jgi:hypothetical protein